jgi:hypothetical protein
MVTEVVLWQDAGFKGDKLVLHGDDQFLTNDFHWDLVAGGRVPMLNHWNDETSSLEITGSPVRFYLDSFFEGKAVDLEPGKHDLADLQAHGIPNDSISSVDFSPFS